MNELVEIFIASLDGFWQNYVGIMVVFGIWEF